MAIYHLSTAELKSLLATNTEALMKMEEWTNLYVVRIERAKEDLEILESELRKFKLHTATQQRRISEINQILSERET
jgi:hypothetical protein